MGRALRRSGETMLDPYRERPAAAAQAQAHWKLKPPRWPVTSTTSPMKKRPGTLRDSMVLLESSSVSTPPTVTSAFSKPSVSAGIERPGVNFFFESGQRGIRPGAGGVVVKPGFRETFGKKLLGRLFRRRLDCACQLGGWGRWRRGRGRGRRGWVRLLASSWRFGGWRGR